MLVSHFELLVKRIANVPSTPTPFSSIFRRIVQGYFISISNLEKRSITIRLKLTIPTTTVPNRFITPGNVNILFDNGGVDNLPLTITQQPSNKCNTVYYTSYFRLCERQTCFIGILPNFGLFGNVLNPDMEVRGFVEIVQRRQIFRPTPRATVLTTPEYRGTYLDNAYPTGVVSDELDFDQIAYSLPLANGRAQGEVEAVKPLIPFPIRPDFDLNDLGKLRLRLLEDDPDLSNDEIEEAVEFLEQGKDNPDFLKMLKAMAKKTD